MAAKYAVLSDGAGTTTQTGDTYNAKRSAAEGAHAWSESTRSKASAVALATESVTFDRMYPGKRRETGIISVVSRIAAEIRIESRL